MREPSEVEPFPVNASCVPQRVFLYIPYMYPTIGRFLRRYRRRVRRGRGLKAKHECPGRSALSHFEVALVPRGREVGAAFSSTIRQRLCGPIG